MEKLKVDLIYPDSQTAWVELNRYFINNANYIVNYLDGYNGGNTLALPNATFIIDRLKVKSDFDFNKAFNYSISKWTLLISNYVDLEKLRDFKARFDIANKKKTFNESFHFTNSHGHGKGCLLTLTISKRIRSIRKKGVPYNYIVTIHMRSSEITKRLLMDLLLIERIVDFILGKESKNCKTVFHVCNLYQDIISATMLEPIIGIEGNIVIVNKWNRNLLKFLRNFTENDIENQNRKVYKRSMKVLQNKTEGEPLLAKQLKLKI